MLVILAPWAGIWLVNAIRYYFGRAVVLDSAQLYYGALVFILFMFPFHKVCKKCSEGEMILLRAALLLVGSIILIVFFNKVTYLNMPSV